MKNKFLISILFLAFIMTGLSSTWAEDEGKNVVRVNILGNRRVSESYVHSQIKTTPGKPFSRTVLDEDLKRLYATGFFRDVKIDADQTPGGVAIAFLLIEKALVKEMVIKGARKIKEKKIRKTMKLKKGDILNEALLVRDVESIKVLYIDKGFSHSSVDYRVNVDEKIGHAVVTISIDEGSRVRIKDITIEGNTVFKDKKIRKIMKTKRKWFFGGGYFNEDEFDDDKLRILDLYQTEGYVDAKIEDIEIRLGEDEEDMFIQVTLIEGSTYPVGKIVIQGNRIFPTEEIVKQIMLAKGIVFIPKVLRSDANAIRDFYMSRGYVDASIKPEIIYNEKSGALDVLYTITENDLSYIEQIVIQGNSKTKDIVIRRELAVRPGDIFDGVRVRRSQERLLNLGYFQSVFMEIGPTPQPDRKDLIIKVEETKTGELGFGAGFSSIDKIIGFVEITQKNFDWANFPSFSGDGQKLRIRAQFGMERQDYILSWTEPWLFDRPMSFGFDVYRRNRRFLSDVYDEVRTGGDLRFGKRLSEFIRADIVYRFESITIEDVSESASDLIKAEEGTSDVSSVELGFTRDTRNHPLVPSKGMRNTLVTEVAGGRVRV